MVQIESAKELVKFLRRPTLRTRIGLWLMPLEAAGREREIVVRLGVEAVDIRAPFCINLAHGTEFLRLSTVKIVETLDIIASQSGQSDCVLVYNLDLLLAGISQQECQQLWGELFNGLPYRPRALLLAIPETAEHLLPADEKLDSWRRDNRVAG